jgi:hypothetical protein
MIDRALADAQLEQLPAGDDTVLLCGYLSDYLVVTNRLGTLAG